MRSLSALLSVAALMSVIPVSVTQAQRATPAPAVRTIQVTGTDDLKFTPSLIEAAPGERLRVTLRVVSRLPKASMPHNIAFLKNGADVKALIQASMLARDTEYFPPAFHTRVLAVSALIGNGETADVEFVAPKTRGNFPFVCTFPGHYDGGMKGTLTVK